MASSTVVPIEQSQAKLSFAKVAASAYKPPNAKEPPPNASAPVMPPQPTTHLQSANPPPLSKGDAPKVRIQEMEDRHAKEKDTKEKEKVGSTAIRTGQWANTTGPQATCKPGSKEEEPEKPRPAITLVKSSATEDSTTQLSSSDGSAKPPSLDGKSVASATTFALDEKESIRPDDSASLRAVEEEDVTSPPDSVTADSRVGSDSGVARAFSDQLHEIAVIGPLPRRGAAPPGRFPSANSNSPHTLYDPNQPPNGINGMQAVAGPQNLPAIPDEKLIEALESPRDRLFVLKIEQDFIDFIKDSRENELSLPNFNTFYRMLAHRLADYYLLGHVVDTTLTGVKITRTPYCRIPPPLSGLPVSSKNANTPPVDLPARKIMRRGDDKSGTNTTANSENPSKTTSEVGGTSGSDGGNDEADGKDKSALTREEREARYREARQRIFGNSENGESESAEAIGSGEERDISRSSSTSGKKKSKKQRNYDDDGFEARSRFNAYYPQQYAVPSYGGDNAVYYGGFPGQIPAPQFPGMNANVSPPPTFNNAYPVMMPQDAQPQYGWPGQQYQPPSAPMAYPSYPPAQNGYDLSADFQRGMQSFQSAGMPSQVTPKMANPPMASYQESYQSQAQPMPPNAGWPQMNQQPSYPIAQLPYAQNGPGNRPMSAPVQGPLPGSYAYGQFPTSPYNGKPNRNQHPLPGSFNRQQFNPQSQAFIPGGRNVPFQMQPNMPPGPTQGMNGYGNYHMPAANQMPRLSPPVAYTQSFGSPQGMQHSNPLPAKSNNSPFSQGPQIASSQMGAAPQGSSQSSTSSIPAQSSIAKWGTPSHLPPRPPPPAQPQPPKFNLPGNNILAPVPRAPNNAASGYNANPQMIRGGTGVSMAHNNST
ncbi:hypothetical protein K505DRAFT_407371 [Melanomma pulvis-pyrius CBS 109.77]|uniref:SUZ domain-containing protein n=1 Tax=Melanomma pulvis-pyrius CBS 109.77 TaxID=1314802 RepID=A0A6A6XFL7_9PLEO|nr:hypothetical protein K505DRAFT_407371 [Melanomma pulvis-pyrius CBS 109.77]